MYVSEKYITEHSYNEGIISGIRGWFNRIRGKITLNDKAKAETKKDAISVSKALKEFEECKSITPWSTRKKCDIKYLTTVKSIFKNSKVCKSISEEDGKSVCQKNLDNAISSLNKSLREVRSVNL